MKSKLVGGVLALVCMVGLASAKEKLVVPYILKAPMPITVDGILDEWSFAFPLQHNDFTVPLTGRARAEGWMEEDPYDCSGTLYMMYDEEYFYFAASVRDDQPGYFSDAAWAADAVEFYIANWDIGSAYVSPTKGGMPNDAATGDYALQFGISFDVELDSVAINCYGGFSGVLGSANTKAVYSLWERGDGYNIEGKIFLADVVSPTTGNAFKFTPGTRIPCAWSIYDIDESRKSADFRGLAYTPAGYAAWQGPGPGWQCADVLTTPRGNAWEQSADFDFVAPFIKKAYNPVTVDGLLNEWNFCFPADHNDNTVPLNGRARAEGWMQEDPYDCSGTVYVMYDDEYLYVAASVRDDEPGYFSDATWAADAVEIYLGNWSIGNDLHAENMGGMPNDPATGDYALQFGITFDAELDSIALNVYGGMTGNIKSAKTTGAYQLWESGDGYDIEAKIFLEDVVSPTTGNQLVFAVGDRLPFAWSIYDIDESRKSADFRGLTYTPAGYAAWQGPGPGWQYVDVKGISVIEAIDAGTSVDERPQSANSWRLAQNYPNPFNPATTIEFELERTQTVTLKVYDVLGKEVAVLANGFLSAGQHRVQFSAGDLSGGIYFYQLKADDFTETRRMVLMK